MLSEKTPVAFQHTCFLSFEMMVSIAVPLQQILITYHFYYVKGTCVGIGKGPCSWALSDSNEDFWML